jgi:arylsulfatase A-like enzyme
MRRLTGFLVPLGAIAVLASGLGVATPSGSVASPVSAAASVKVAAPPNIVVIMSDDQRRNTFQTMPTVRKKLIQKGLKYVGFSPTSACCPARSSLLTAQFAHTTGVYNNVDPTYGGWPAFNGSGYEQKTIAVALDQAGYRTGLVGKYMNLWNKAPDGFVPDGWDVFRALWSDIGQGGGRYYDYQIRGTQDTEKFGSKPKAYSTDVLADRAVRFIKSSPVDQPFFLYFTPFAAHEPWTPAPRHKGTWQPDKVYDNPAVNEKDMSDKPAFMQDLPRIDRDWIKRAQDKTGESLRAVDEAVARVLKAVGDRRSNTLFIYTSDQGVMWGEHRLDEKYNPYRWATEFPLIMKWGKRFPVADRDRLVANADVGATILDAANVVPTWPIEGTSVLGPFRSDVVLEAIGIPGQPAYCGLRLKNWLYVHWSGDAGVELYDYVHDPLELKNLAGRTAYAEKEQAMHDRTVELCSPTPPGFSWD